MLLCLNKKISLKIFRLFLITILLNLVLACSKKDSNPNYQFQQRFGKEVLLIKSQYGIKEDKKQKKIEKIDVSKKSNFPNDDEILQEVVINNEFNEQYFPFVESEQYFNQYLLSGQYLNLSSDNFVISQINNQDEKFNIKYYNILYGPFIKLENPFDEIKIPNNNSYWLDKKIYPLIPQSSLKYSIIGVKNNKFKQDIETSIAIIATKKNEQN
jgi:hypothetical protein